MKRCKCSDFAGSVKMFHGGKMHWQFWLSQAAEDPQAHHPNCEKYDAIEQLKLVEVWLEYHHLYVREVRGTLERRRREYRKGGLKLV